MQNAEPILVVTTGGTIDKQYFDALSEHQVAATMVPRMFELASVAQPFEMVELMQKDSLELADVDRSLILETVLKSRSTRVVITHGTDTMTTTARVLEAVTGKTIVLVGALAPARFSESDASFNLGMAFATVQAAPAGIYIAMNGTVFPAGKVEKDREQGSFIWTG